MFKKESNIIIFVIVTLSLHLYNCQVVYDVIVIGAGVSGLSAANTLSTNGRNNFLVLEASNRLGGRVNTVRTAEAGLIEIGAQWVHGDVKNPVFDLLKSLGEIDNSYSFFTDETIYSAFPNGSIQREKTVDMIASRVEELFENTLYENPGRLTQNENIGNLLDAELRKLLVSLRRIDPILVRSVFASSVDEQKSDYACNSFYEMSAIGFNQYRNYDGEQYNNLRDGYVKLIDYLSRNIRNRILLNQRVENINWSGNIVTVVATNANGVRISYQAKHVVVSIPLGVLKVNHLSLFTPRLPNDKAAAIQRLGAGIVNKLFFIFEKPLFTDNEAGLQFLWNNVTRVNLASSARCNLNGNEFYRSFNQFTIVPKRPNILFAFLVGRDSLFAENLSDSCLVDIMSELFSRFFPSLNLPRLRSVIRSRWGTDPLFRTSYSFPQVGSTMNEVNTLARTEANKLFFVGEATTPFIGTVHGAYQTGITAANSINRLL